jgi:hypothetical protein
MNKGCGSVSFQYLLLFIVVANLLIACKGRNRDSDQKRIDATEHSFKNVFGENCYATGRYLNSSGDSIETNLWFITNITNSMVIYGDYGNGLSTGVWRFGLKDGSLLSSEWSIYTNGLTKCSFSLPFQYDETTVDSNFFRLRTTNDSLGKVSIVVGITDTIIKDDELAKYGVNSEDGLRRQGYTFRGNLTVIVKGTNKYYFTEYFMKDSSNKDVKFYHLYGYTHSRSHFVDFALFHDGPKDDLVKVIYNLIVTSMYIRNERLFNPYLN